MRYTEHFSDESDYKIMNIVANGSPPQVVISNMQIVLDELEKARVYFGCPFTITSGYRSPARNTSIGGAKGSAHITGEAVDFIVSGKCNLFAVYTYIVNKLNFDQVIYECDGNSNLWIHLAVKKVNRKQALIATYNKQTKKWDYVPYKKESK